MDKLKEEAEEYLDLVLSGLIFFEKPSKKLEYKNKTEKLDFAEKLLSENEEELKAVLTAEEELIKLTQLRLKILSKIKAHLSVIRGIFEEEIKDYEHMPMFVSQAMLKLCDIKKIAEKAYNLINKIKNIENPKIKQRLIELANEDLEKSKNKILNIIEYTEKLEDEIEKLKKENRKVD